MIEIENLSVVFGDVDNRVLAVDGVSLNVAAGESFGLVGESGSGKSTILRAVAGLVDSAGTITINGEKQGKKRDKGFYAQVQMVFQDPFGSLHPKHTIDRILTEPLVVHDMPDREAKVRAVLDQVQLGPSFRFRYPHQLSGGQRQRIAIARALILRPQIILLDDIRNELKVTYLMVSHDLGVVAHMCNRFAVMRQGKVVEVAESGHLSAGTLAHPYSRQLLLASRGYDRAVIDAFADL